MLITDSVINSPLDLALTDNNVHVWYASLRQPSDVTLQLAAMLSGDERERAARYQFEHLRQSFIVARGTLRLILAHYLNLKPGQIQFEYTRTGKPFLSNQPDKTNICFNLSHSNDLVLYAITKDRQVGVDVEFIRPLAELEDIAMKTFSIYENDQLKEAEADQKLKAFFNCWTRKEAYIKAIGDGVSFPLDQFDVSLKPGDPAQILRIFGSEENAERWSMYELQFAEGYVAALVVEGNDCSITNREWKYIESAQDLQEPK